MNNSNFILSAFSIEKVKKNILFFLSGFCFSLLIFYIEGTSLIISVLSLIVSGLLSAFVKDTFSEYKQSSNVSKIISAVFALCILWISAQRFVANWFSSGKIERLASHVHLSNTVLLSTFAGVLALLSLVFLMTVFSLAFTKLKSILSANTKSNNLMILSSFAFMRMNVQPNRNGVFSILLSYILIVLIFSQVTDIYTKIKSIPLGIKLYSLISALGICYYSRIVFCESVSSSSILMRIFEKVSFNQSVLISCLSAVLSLTSVFAVFVLVSILLNYVVCELKKSFKSLSKTELIVYSLLSASLIAFTCFVFLKSNVFWRASLNYDTIYTSDSPILLNNNVYLRLYHSENDLRQPLFAVFAAPFVGFGYTVSIPLSYISPVFTPLFMNAIQVLMLVSANIMLARVINSNAISRVCFMMLTTVTYSTLLFSVMMEQYIVAYFWLIFVIQSYIENKKATVISLAGAGGTLLTSLILIPASYEKGQHNSSCGLRSFIVSVEKSIFGFLIALFAFGRLDVLLNFPKRIMQLSNCAGGESIAGRIKQYLSFVSSCFIAPDAIVDKTAYDYVSWQLSKSVISEINIVGIVILVLCFVSFIVNKRNALARISALWVCFSVLLLCVVGWGSPENGMVLYSLYFGWACIVLLFQLINWCSKKLKLTCLIPTVSSIAIAAMAVLNYQGIKELLSFAFTYYPA